MPKVYFLGICGTAMATLAVMMKNKGYKVAGSDEGAFPPMLDYLKKNKIPIKSPYKISNLKDKPDFVVIGNSLSRGNSEVEYILEQKIPFFSLPEILKNHFLKNNLPIVVSGTHGKSSTTSLITFLLNELKLDPGFFIGAASVNFTTFGRSSKKPNDYFVIEGDEYDSAFFDKKSKFFHYFPHHLIINNIEFDHADIFRDESEIVRAFSHLTRLVPKNGWILANGDDKNVIKAVKDSHTKVILFGKSKRVDYLINKIKPFNQSSMIFSLKYQPNQKVKNSWEFKIPLLGEMNVFNATAAIICCLELGFKPDIIQKNILNFKNAKKRLELKTNQNKVLVFDDFAHHPTAIQKTLSGIKKAFKKYRIWAIYEPRSNTSIAKFHQNYLADAFQLADNIIFFKNKKLQKVPKNKQLDLDLIIKQLKKNNKETLCFSSTEKLKDHLVLKWQANDVIVFLSQGDLNNLPEELSLLANQKWS